MNVQPVSEVMKTHVQVVIVELTYMDLNVLKNVQMNITQLLMELAKNVMETVRHVMVLMPIIV
jgi:hypothetical protein